jgi:lysozyme
VSRIAIGVAGLVIAVAALGAASFEGNRSHAYRDSGGQWTICEGHSRGVMAGDVATPGQCAEYKRSDRLRANAELDRCTSAQLTPNQRDAFVSVVQNIGGTAFCNSTIARKINGHDIRGACWSIGLYMSVAGRDCRIKANNCAGIVKRRMAEMDQCWPNFGTNSNQTPQSRGNFHV